MNELVVPVPIVRYAARKRCLTQVRIYLYMKLNSDGAFPVSADLRKPLGIIDQRTIDNHVNWLLENHWIGTDATYYFDRPWHRIYKNHSLQGKIGSFISNKELAGSDIFRAWVSTTMIAYLIRGQKGRRYFQGQNKRSTLQRNTSSLPSSYFGVSNSLLAKELDCSIKTSCQHKQLAERYGFLKTWKRYKLATNIAKEHVHALRAEGVTNIVMRGGKPYFQLYDQIQTKSLIKRKSHLQKGKHKPKGIRESLAFNRRSKKKGVEKGRKFFGIKKTMMKYRDQHIELSYRKSFDDTNTVIIDELKKKKARAISALDQAENLIRSQYPNTEFIELSISGWQEKPNWKLREYFQSRGFIFQHSGHMIKELRAFRKTLNPYHEAQSY